MDRETQEELFEKSKKIVYDVYHKSFKNTIGVFVKHGMSHEDLLQEGFYILWKQLPKYDPNRGTIATFAYRVVYMAMLDYLKKKEEKHAKTSLYDGFTNDEGQEASVLEFMADDCAPTEDEIINSISLRKFLDGLNESDKHLINLKFNGLGQREIAAEIGMSQGHVSRQLKRIRKRWERVAG